MSEWKIDDADIEEQLAARLAEAVPFCFNLGFDGPRRTSPTRKLGQELVRFYKTIEKVAEEQRRANGKAALDDVAAIRVFCRFSPKSWRNKGKRKRKLEFVCDPALLYVDYDERCADYAARYERWKRWLEFSELTKRRENKGYYTDSGWRKWDDADEAKWREAKVEKCVQPKEPDKALGFCVHKGDPYLWGAYSDESYDEIAYLGELRELIGWAKTGGEEARKRWRFGAFASCWRNRVASLIDCQIERYRAVYEAAKELYVLILTTPPTRMKNVEIFVSRDGFKLATERRDGSFVRVGTLLEFYATADGCCWGKDFSTERKFNGALEARHWLTEVLCK